VRQYIRQNPTSGECNALQNKKDRQKRREAAVHAHVTWGVENVSGERKHRLHPAVPYNPAQHNRQSIRLPRWDYRRPGAYFVTTCTHDRVCLSGSVVDGRMALNAYGRIVVEEWRRTERVRDNVVLDAFVVMPNHVYGIIGITAHPDGDGVNRDGNTSPGASTGDIGTNHRRGSSAMNPYGHPNRSFGGTVAGSLSTIMRQFKPMVTTRAERLTK